MTENALDQVFQQLDISTPMKLGTADDDEQRRQKAVANYRKGSKEIQVLLSQAAMSRARVVQLLNTAFFVIITILILSVIGQLLLSSKATQFLVFIQAACAIAIFPIARQMERRASTQAHVEFVAAFLPDLEPAEAIKAIDQLYQTITHPGSLRKVIRASKK